jgi:hypothetical protein
VTGQRLLFDPVSGKSTAGVPSPRPATAASMKAERDRRREWSRKAAARRAALREKRQRHDDAERRFTLPGDVRLFLERLYVQPSLWPYDEPRIDRERVEELLREVYVQGCTEGYVEGRVLGMERDRLVSQKRNQRKRQKRSLDDRDAAIAAEYVQLCGMMAVGQARERLASKYECDPRTIYNVARKAGLVAPRSHNGRKA